MILKIELQRLKTFRESYKSLDKKKKTIKSLSWGSKRPYKDSRNYYSQRIIISIKIFRIKN